MKSSGALMAWEAESIVKSGEIEKKSVWEEGSSIMVSGEPLSTGIK